MQKILFSLFLLFCSLTAAAEEITLFNADGEATAYIDANDEDLTIYMWNGTPVAYLSSKGDYYHIYGFNGEHLGWFDEGLVIDHNGCVVGFQKGVVSCYTRPEPYKSYKKYKPYKSYKKYAPYKPYTRKTFSNEKLSLFLMKGKRS